MRFPCASVPTYAGVAQWSGHQPSKLGMRVRFPSPAPRPNTWTKCLKSRAERFRDGTNDDEFRGATPLYLASIWEHSSIGRAPALQAGGRGFDSRWFQHAKLNDVGVAEQADAADLKSAGIHRAGSIPVSGTTGNVRSARSVDERRY